MVVPGSLVRHMKQSITHPSGGLIVSVKKVKPDPLFLDRGVQLHWHIYAPKMELSGPYLLLVTLDFSNVILMII